MAETMQEIDDLNSRAAIYRLLSHFYRKEITLSLVEKMNETGLLEEFERLGYEIDAEKLKDEAFLRELKIEYAKAFLGPGPHLSLYGSVHHPDDPKKGRLWGDTTVWVRRFVMDHGLEFKGEAYDGMPDHIGHELEFFSRLVEQEAEVRKEGEEDKIERLLNSQRIFFHKQLKKWIPEFCSMIPANTTASFYKEVARLTTDLLQLEESRLPDIDSQPN